MDWNVVAAGAGRTLRLDNSSELIIKEDGSYTRGNLVAAEMVMQPDFVAPPQHIHHAHEEAWYVLDGEVDFISGARVRRAGPGDWVVAPLGIPHTFANPGDVPTRLLTFFTPRLYLDYLTELGEKTMRALKDSDLPPGRVRGRIAAETMPKYQTEILADPAAWDPGTAGDELTSGEG